MKVPLARQMIEALPAAAVGQPPDWGLVYHRVQVLRRSDRDEEAWTLLASVPNDASAIATPDDWWVERRANAYQALKAGKPRIAYDLVKDAGYSQSIQQRSRRILRAGWRCAN